MATTLEATVTDILNRLSDSDNAIWSRAEIKLYLTDGYDEFCRRTSCLFDIFAIPNLPPVGNWQTDLERYFALQRPGWGLTDEPFHFTNDNGERNFGTGGQTGGNYAGPVGMTSPGDRERTLQSTDAVPTTCPGGTLSQSVVEVLRVSYNKLDLVGLYSDQASKIDPQYENRGAGDPQFYTFDKDGMFYLRLIPAGSGTAVYDDTDGSWGTMTYTDDTDVTVVTTEVTGVGTGGFGILRYRTDMFPSGGPWGTPTQVHPDDANIKVEVTRLGRDLSHYPSELPLAYQKYPVYYAMAKALRRDGNGQELDLAQHFDDRFEMGVERLTRKRDRMTAEETVRFGGGASSDVPFGGMGLPQAPYPYGVAR